MVSNISQRKAALNDLGSIVNLLMEDELGKTRETTHENLDRRYIDAFHRIDADPNQYLMVVEHNNEIVGT